MISQEILDAAAQLALRERGAYAQIPHLLFDLAHDQALRLADALGADRAVCELGMYFMDAKLGQALKEQRPGDHVAMGVELAEVFLAKHKVDDETTAKVLNAIEAHHGKVPFNSLESEICTNADCYKFLHPRGFFYYLYFLGERGTPFEQALHEAGVKLDEKYDLLSLDICKQELETAYRDLKKYLAIAQELE